VNVLIWSIILNQDQLTRWQRVENWAIVVLGCAGCVATTYSSLAEWIKGSKEASTPCIGI